jgi:hypothetical protein
MFARKQVMTTSLSLRNTTRLSSIVNTSPDMVRPVGRFRFYYWAAVECYSMTLRSAGLVGIAYLMVLGCASPVVQTTKTPESEQRKRQEQWIRGDSPIGEVGPMGAPSTLGTPRAGTIRDDLYPRDPRYPTGNPTGNQPWRSAFE